MAAGQLWVNLGLRSAAFDKGMKKSHRSVQTFGSSVKRMGTRLLAVAGVAGFGYMIRQQLKMIDSTAKLSDRIGITTEALVALQHGASIAGVETETLNKSMEIFSRRLGEIQLGTGEAERALDALGFSYKQLVDKSPDEAIGMVADAINKLGTQTEKAAVANFLFGRSGAQLLNLFAGGSKGIEEFRQEVEQLGLSFSRIDAAKVEAANDALTRSKAIMTGLFRSATIELAPFIEAAASAFNDWATSGEGVGQKMVDIFEQVARSIVAVADELVNMSRNMDAFLNPLDTLKAGSDATTRAYKRYREQTGERAGLRNGIDLMQPSIRPKDRALFNRIREEEYAKAGLIPQSRQSTIRDIFAKIREDAAALASQSTATTKAQNRQTGLTLPSLAKRRMSAEAWDQESFELERQGFFDAQRQQSGLDAHNERLKQFKQTQEAQEDASSDRARSVERMYSTMQVYDKRAYQAKRSLLQQELKEFKALGIEQRDIHAYKLEQMRLLDLEYYEKSDDIAKGFATTWEELERNRLTLGEVGGGMAKSIHGEWVGAFQDMATEGANWKDSMEGFFKNVGKSFSNMMAQMAAEALLFDAIQPAFSGLFGGLFKSMGSPASTPGGPGFTNSPGIIEDLAPSAQHGGTVMKTGLAVIHKGETYLGEKGGAVPVEVRITNEGQPAEITSAQSYMLSDRRIIDVSMKAASNDRPYQRAHGR